METYNRAWLGSMETYNRAWLGLTTTYLVKGFGGGDLVGERPEVDGLAPHAYNGYPPVTPKPPVAPRAAPHFAEVHATESR